MIIKARTIPFREKVAGKSISSIFFLLLFFTGTQLFSPAAFAQSDSIAQKTILNTKVTLSLKNISIQKILDTLSAYPNVKFSYVNYDLPLQDKINVEVYNQNLQEVLEAIFQPYRIKYYVVAKQIVLKKEKKTIGLQNNTFAPHSISKFSISLYYSHGISYRRLRSNNPVLINERNKVEKSSRNFAAGCYVSYQYLPSVILRSGIAFFNTGERGTFSSVSNDTIVAGNNGNGNGSANGNGNGNNVDTLRSTVIGNYKNKYSYLSIPFMIGYTFKKQKVQLSALTGIGLGIFLKSSTTFPLGINNYQNKTAEQIITPNYQKDARTHSYKKMALTIPVIIEMEYHITNQIGIVGSLGFNYFTSSIYQSRENVKHRPYYVNASVGLTYHFPDSKK